MKKFLALALALVMMLAVCVPAFATDIATNGGTGDTTLQTLTTDEDGNPVAGFTVSIPATVEIPWGGTSTGDTLDWSYVSQLQAGKQLSISLDKAAGTFYTDGVNTLAYTLSGDAVGTAFTTGAAVCALTQKSIDIVVTGWDDVPVDAYSDTVTFTVAVVDIV